MKFYVRLNNDKKLEYFEYYATDGFVFKFLNADYPEIKNFFGNEEISEFEILDEDGMVHDAHSVIVKRKSITTEDVVLTSQKEVLKQEAYEELVVDENGDPILNKDGEEQFIHHEAVYDTVSTQMNEELMTVVLARPDINEQLGDIKKKMERITQAESDALAAKTVAAMADTKADDNAAEITATQLALCEAYELIGGMINV